MSAHSRHHYVPQYYFRSFNGGVPYIGVLHKRTGLVHAHAPIRSQGARHRYYRHPELERLLSELESRHSNVLKRARDVVLEDSAPTLTGPEIRTLLEAVSLQRSRTPHGAQLTDQPFKLLLQHLEHDAMMPDSQAARVVGQLQSPDREFQSLILGMGIALISAEGMRDMTVYYVRNVTDMPFVFSDAPAIFYNQLLRYVTSHGVTGIQCPGLQVFLPLSSQALVMILDASSYTVSSDSMQHRIVLAKGRDVQALNALQFCQAKDSVYFCGAAGQHQAEQLYRDYGNMPAHEISTLVVHAPGSLLVHGRPNENEIIQSIVRQLPIAVRFSFVHCDPIPRHRFVFAPRNAALLAKVVERAGKRRNV